MADQALGASNKMDGVARIANGYFTATGEAAVVTLGFRPRKVEVVNITAAQKLEKYDGMAAATTIQTTTALSAEAGSLIVIDNGGFTIATAALAASDLVAWIAHG